MPQSGRCYTYTGVRICGTGSVIADTAFQGRRSSSKRYIHDYPDTFHQALQLPYQTLNAIIWILQQRNPFMGFELGLTPEKALIFRVTHRGNLPWVLDNGLCSSNHPHQDPSFIRIGNADLISSRHQCQVTTHPGGTLADYVPFYFTPYSVMLLNIVTGRNVKAVDRNNLVILVSSLHKVAEQGIPFLYTDRHAYLFNAIFRSDLHEIDQQIDWRLLQWRDFKRDPQDPEKMNRYQAEALVHWHLPIDALLGIVTYSQAGCAEAESLIAERGLALKAISRPDWFFQ